MKRWNRRLAKRERKDVQGCYNLILRKSLPFPLFHIAANCLTKRDPFPTIPATGPMSWLRGNSKHLPCFPQVFPHFKSSHGLWSYRRDCGGNSTKGGDSVRPSQWWWH